MGLAPFDWTCPFCGRDTTIIEERFRKEVIDLEIENSDGLRRLNAAWVVCPNRACRKLTLTASVDRGSGSRLAHTWRLLPSSSARAFPDFIPRPIKEDYEEACAIRDLSPKASATLSRRCLQGMIRDFWGISRDKLLHEINALEGMVDPLTWKSIDAIRSIGNIGAHMEKDINVIVDVEPDEAQQLIGLIELLIRDWYITRHEREERLKAVVALGEAKKTAKAGLPDEQEDASTDEINPPSVDPIPPV